MWWVDVLLFVRRHGWTLVRRKIFLDFIQRLRSFCERRILDTLEALSGPSLGFNEAYETAGSGDRAAGQADEALVAVPAAAQNYSHFPNSIEFATEFLGHVKIHSFPKKIRHAFASRLSM